MKLSTKEWRTIRGMKAVVVWIGLLAAPLVLTAATPPAPKADFILYGGDIVTLDKAGTVAEAVWVRDGRIEAVGTRQEILRQAPETTERIDLRGHALLPGFVEPHLHLDALTLTSFFTDLIPCLPDRYETREKGKCPLTILKALEDLKNSEIAFNTWLVGNGIDPSLMTLDGNQPASAFQADPQKYIDTNVSATRPVFILDRSGHLAYVNRQAFVAAGICEKAETCGPKTANSKPESPGEWKVDKDGHFTGLLLKVQAYKPFENALGPYLPSSEDIFIRACVKAQEFARAGLTTMANGGTGTVALFQNLAKKFPPLLRYRALVQWNDTQGFAKPTPWDESNNALFGVTGIKLVADGSTQGCTASLIDRYNERGSCGSADMEMANFNTKQIVANLKPFWKAGWPIQIHTNGDQAIMNALDALADLQMETRNDSPITLIHFTVDGNPSKGEDMVQKVADLRAGRWLGKPVPPIDVRVSHLIGHVAYWGGALQNILDGVSGPKQPDETGRAARLDATQRELKLGVPLSLHSDAPVSPVHPLWYVEQAVTRNTWFYPKLTDADVHTMPGGQSITIAQALEAVTIEPARQHGLDRYIGSIEKGKATTW